MYNSWRTTSWDYLGNHRHFIGWFLRLLANPRLESDQSYPWLRREYPETRIYVNNVSTLITIGEWELEEDNVIVLPYPSEEVDLLHRFGIIIALLAVYDLDRNSEIGQAVGTAFAAISRSTQFRTNNSLVVAKWPPEQLAINQTGKSAIKFDGIDGWFSHEGQLVTPGEDWIKVGIGERW